MSSRKNVSPARISTRSSQNHSIRRAVTEALENRQLFAVGLISVGLGGAAANGPSGQASVSADGRYVVFASKASNLVAGDTNDKQDIFLRDRQNGTTILISKNPTSGDIGNGESTLPVINQDGTFVAFTSRSSNLVSNDTLGFQDVFRYNISTGALQLVSATNTAGTTHANGNSGEPTISKDGNIISFTSFAPNLGGVDGNAENDIYVRNMTTGQNRLVSVNTGGVAAGNALSFDSWVSEDGRYITFRSDASNLVASDTNGNRDTFLRDTVSNTTTLISVNTAGASANSGSESNAVSGNGRYVVFQSRATDIVSNDGNGTTDVFLRDTQNNTTTLLSVNRFGNNSAGGFSQFPAISQDGSWATFSSLAPDVVTDDSNGREDVFVRDLARGPMSLISRNTSGAPANGRSYDPFINRNGDFVVFTSDASDLVANDSNSKDDIFISDIPEPVGGSDTTAPTATFGSLEAVSPGATKIRFTVNLADNSALNTVAVGALSVTKSGGGTFTATRVGIVGTGQTAIVTYEVDFGSAIESNFGDYTVNVPSGAVKDAAGNNAATGAIGTFTLAAPGGGGGVIGDPNGPDLQITGLSRLPASAIGTISKGKVKFKVVNAGPGILNHNATYTVYLSADTTQDAGDVQVASVTKFLKKIKAGKSKSLSAKWVYPGGIGDGNYYVLVKADTANNVSESNESNNTGASATTVLVQAPFVDLQPVLVSKPSRTTAGATAVVTAKIQNNGNVQFRNATGINLVVVQEAVSIDGASQVIGTITPTLKLKPRKTQTVKFSVTMPTLAAGNYELGAVVDVANQHAESSETNNIAKSFVFTVA